MFSVAFYYLNMETFQNEIRNIIHHRISRFCDDDFLQREMSYIDFYRDAKSANLHIIVKGERSSTGGEIVTFRFIGIEEFKGVENTLLLDVPPNTSDNDERLLYLEMLKKGIYAYIIRTSDKDNVSISFGETTL